MSFGTDVALFKDVLKKLKVTEIHIDYWRYGRTLDIIVWEYLLVNNSAPMYKYVITHSSRLE